MTDTDTTEAQGEQGQAIKDPRLTQPHEWCHGYIPNRQGYPVNAFGGFDCPVCGFPLLDEKFTVGDICPSCGTESGGGGEDYREIPFSELTTRWRRRGCPFWQSKFARYFDHRIHNTQWFHFPKN